MRTYEHRTPRELYVYKAGRVRIASRELSFQKYLLGKFPGVVVAGRDACGREYRWFEYIVGGYTIKAQY